MGKLQKDANKTGWSSDLLRLFKDFDHFKIWFDQKYKNAKAETIWKKIGGTIEKKEKPQN